MSDDTEEDAFEARYNARRQRMLSRPPRCLAPFAVALAAAQDLPGMRFDGHGESDESIFRVRCACGGESFRVRGSYHAKDFRGDPLDFFGDPLELTCESCNQTKLLFDADKDGYNPQIEAAEDLTRPKRRSNDPEPPRIEYGCTQCGSRAMHIWTRFEHCADTCEDSFAEDLSEGREQDFFSWFTLVGRCAKCGALPDGDRVRMRVIDSLREKARMRGLATTGRLPASLDSTPPPPALSRRERGKSIL